MDQGVARVETGSDPSGGFGDGRRAQEASSPSHGLRRGRRGHGQAENKDTTWSGPESEAIHSPIVGVWDADPRKHGPCVERRDI